MDRAASDTAEVLASAPHVADTAWMRLAFDTVGARFGGTAVVARDIVAASLRCPDIDHVLVFATARPERQFDFPDDPRLEVVELSGLATSGAARVPWQMMGLRRRTRQRGSELVVGLSNGGVGGRGLPAAVFVQQALPFASDVLREQPLALRTRMQLIRKMIGISTRTACAVGVQTAAMRDAMIREFRLRPDKLHVVDSPAPEFPPAATDSPRLNAIQRTPRGGRILFVGSALAYKNLQLAVKAVCTLRTTVSAATLFAVTDGPVASADGIALPSLSRAELRAVYERSDVLVMPSLVESLGLPLLEAMRLGLPVVTVDRPYARDTCGDAAVFAAAESPDAVAEALSRVLVDATFRDRLVAAGRARVAQRDRQDPYQGMIRRFVHAAGLRGVEYL